MDFPMAGAPRDVLIRFSNEHRHDRELQEAISLFRLGTFSYETFHATHPWDDVALLHFSTMGIVGLMLFSPLPEDSCTSEEDSPFFDDGITASSELDAYWGLPL